MGLGDDLAGHGLRLVGDDLGGDGVHALPKAVSFADLKYKREQVKSMNSLKFLI